MKKYLICWNCKTKIGMNERIDTLYYSFYNRVYTYLCWRCNKPLRKEK